MARSRPKTAKPSAKKKPSRVTQAAKQVAVDAEQVRQDLNRLLLSLEDLSVEALREVSNRALALIDEKTGARKRSFLGGVIGGAMDIGGSITGLFGKSADEPAPRKPRTRKPRTADSA